MRDLGPWDREPPTVPAIRALALRSLRTRGYMLAMTGAATTFACWAAFHLNLPTSTVVLMMVAVLLQAVPFARSYLPMTRQWHDLGDSHRGLGLSRLHYASITLDTLMLLVPAIGAATLLACACGAFG